LVTITVKLFKNRPEINIAALPYHIIILDMKNLDTVGIFFQVFNRILFSKHGPEYIKLEKHLFRIGILNKEIFILPVSSGNIDKFHAMVVVTEFKASLT